MPFTYPRTVRLADTDAAGVVYFTRVLSMCHEAYEESLATSGIDLKTFFDTATAIPIVRAEVDFLKPIIAGDHLLIQLTVQQLSDNEFESTYQVTDSSSEKPVAKAKTKHVCIDANSRRRNSFPEPIKQWLLLSSLASQT